MGHAFKSMSRAKESIRKQTQNHNNHPIYGQCKTQLSQQDSAPLACGAVLVDSYAVDDIVLMMMMIIFLVSRLCFIICLDQ